MTKGPDLQEAAEQLALVLSTHGLQRMTARVLAALLVTERIVHAAPAVVVQSAMASRRESDPLRKRLRRHRRRAQSAQAHGARLQNDASAVLVTLTARELAPKAAMLKAAEAGIATTGGKTLAGQRLIQMRDFYNFLLAEIPALLDRWHRQSGR